VIVIKLVNFGLIYEGLNLSQFKKTKIVSIRPRKSAVLMLTGPRRETFSRIKSGHHGRILMIFMTPLLIVMRSHSDSQVLTGLAAADIIGFFPRNQALVLMIGGIHRLTHNFMAHGEIMRIIPFHALDNLAVVLIINRSAGTLDQNHILAVVILEILDGIGEKVVIVTITVIAVNADIVILESAHGFAADRT
jgi:hypothetical protein